MFTRISIHSVPVLDQQEALDFYVGKLGFEVSSDVDLGFMRWLTVALPSDPIASCCWRCRGHPR